MNPQTLAKRKYTKKSSVIENVPRMLPNIELNNDVIISNSKKNKKMNKINIASNNALKTIEKNFANIIDVVATYKQLKDKIFNDVRIPNNKKKIKLINLYNKLIQRHRNKNTHISKNSGKILNY